MAAYRYGAYPRAQRLALLVLLAVTTGVTVLTARWGTDRTTTSSLPALQLLHERAVRAVANRPPTPEDFAFDPNTVTRAELIRLGLTDRQAGSWLKFRGNRSNAFRRSEDIGKLYVLDAATKERLIALAYVDIKKQQERARSQVQGFAFDPNAVTAPQLRRLGLSEKQTAAFVKYRSRSGNGQTFRRPEDLRRLGVLTDDQKDLLVRWARVSPPEPAASTRQRFIFDPNRISADSMALLGFPDWQVRSFLKYRGGRTTTFRRPEDLRRVGALDSSLVEAVLDLVVIPPPPHDSVAAVPATYASKPPPPAPASFDVNRGNLTAWRSLPGIGEYRAKQIIKYRNRFGGFYRLEQLAETPGLPDSTFRRIEPYLTIGPVFRRLSVNRASFEELKRHPYVSRALANVIVRNREKFGPFRDAADLRRIRLITDENLPTLLPYLSFE